jgi:hypothetical protein
MRFEPLLFVFALGCGEGLPFLGGDDAAADVVAEADAAPFETGPHGPLPQQVDLTDGGVVAAMNVVPIFFANDSLQNGVVSLLSQLPASGYWSALESEYGVGPLTVAPPIVLSDTPPSAASQSDVVKFIASKLGTDPSWPAPTENTLYFIYYPLATTLTFDTSSSCVDFLGYHYYGQTGPSTRFLFAVQGRCSNGNIPPIDDATQNTTHELVEAATDPFLLSYATVDPAHVVWSVFPGFEIGDMCELESLTYQRMVGASLVARFWANSSAAAGHDPCAPAITTPYFNAVPVLPDQVSITLFTGPVLTSGIAIPTGTTKTIDVQLFSDAQFGPWNLEADDATNFAKTNAGELVFVWDKPTGTNGDTRQLKITRVKDGPFGGTEFVIHSFASTTIWHEYFAFAGN